jgi:hypothetical protein
VHVRIIEDETSVLSDQDAAKADAILADAAPGKTFGELRSAAHKLVLKLDPEAAKKRKESAKQEAHVRPFRENSGNAGMVARELPSDEVLASWQHVEQRALDLRAAGMPGTLRELRVRAYLDLLQERDSRDIPVDGGTGEAGPIGRYDGPDLPDGPDGKGNPGGNGPGGPGPAPQPGPAAGPSVAALVTITIPWATLQGRSEGPGEADGFGPLDGDDARDLAAAAARHPRTPRPPPLPPSLSPRCTPTAPPPPTAASQVGISRPAPGPPVP